MLSSINHALVTAAGDPIPPQSVVQRLKERCPRLSIHWVGGQVKSWALKQRWAQGDPRWEHVQTGRIRREDALDFLQLFPADCSGEDMAAFAERYYGERNMLSKADAAKEASRIVDDQIARDQRQMEANVAQAHERSMERHERESGHDLRVRAGVEKAHPMIVVP